MLQDLRYAVRAARRNPGFAAAAVVSLAIGIGVNAALFSLINGILWKSLPVGEPETLLVLSRLEQGGTSYGFTYGNYAVFRDHVRGLRVAAYGPASLNVAIDGRLEPTLRGHLVTGSYFPLLRIVPAAGRLLGPADDRNPGAHPVVVLGHDYWQRRFGADPGVIGRPLSISGHPFTIVGVTPRDFFGAEVGAAPDLFLPVMMQPTVMPMTANLVASDTHVTSTWLRILARTAPGTTVPQAVSQLEALAGVPETEWRFRNKFTQRFEEARLALEYGANGLSDLRRQFSQPLFLLLGIAGLVLLIACANVGSLVLARAATRQPEFALRLALGAGRGRLLRQVLAESVVLAVPGGAAALVLAYWAALGLVAYAAAGREAIVLDVSPDWRVLAFTALVSIAAAMVLGSIPAIQAARIDWFTAGSLSRVRGTGGRMAAGQALVTVQIALSLVLLAGAGLFVRSLQNLSPQHVELDESRLLVVRIEPPGSGNRNTPGVAAALDRMYRTLLSDLRELPGVASVSLARSSPLEPTRLGFPVARAAAAAVEMMTASIVYPGYFTTMRMPIVRGRDFSEADLMPGAPAAVLVNEAFVRTVLGSAAPLGDGHGVRTRRGETLEPLNIIGVVKDSRFPDLREAVVPTVYQSFLQANTGFGGMTLHVRLSEVREQTVSRIRAAVQAAQPGVPMFQLHTLADEVDAALIRERLVATLAGVFGAIALVLIAVGLHGMMAFNVARRTAEIGVRVALGATPAEISGLFARDAARVLAAGIAIGLPCAVIAGKLAADQLAALLYGLTAIDPVSFGAAMALLALVTLAAAVLPAVRASRINPIVALRVE